ncbi:MAG: deoxynucleoside kinase [Nanoarchaeota archaeon]
MTRNNFRIEICGIVASGKTTLANMLSLHKIEPTLENFRDNPFWKDFCKDPSCFMFETEMVFLLQHYHQIKTIRNRCHICDFSIFLDLSYALLSLYDDKKNIFTYTVEEVLKEISYPDLVIHLKCDPQVALDRIKKRGRVEECNINLSFLNELNLSIETQLDKYISNNVIRLNSSEIDFTSNNSNIENIMIEINNIFNVKMEQD